MPQRFAKYHGLGNDFVLVDARVDSEGSETSEASLMSPERARMICERHLGVGADGVLTLRPPSSGRADLRMHLFNADGSEAEMCGNGLRCVVLFECARTGVRQVRVETDAGLMQGSLEDDGRVRVTLGRAEVIESDLALTFDDGSVMRGAHVSMGNPHFVVRPEPGASPEAVVGEALRLGPIVQAHAAFPRSVNVEICAPEGPGVRLAVFERGAGLTRACGTGAGATAAALATWGDARERFEVTLPGGALDVLVAREGGALAISIVGPAAHVYDGVLS